ncbi:MAG: DUF6465 family protein [Agathobacter sp.]|nr:DUF6465 family protein [Agathobacter sp.]
MAKDSLKEVEKVAEVKPAAKAETKTTAKTETKATAKPAAKKETKTAAKPAAKKETKAATKTTAKKEAEVKTTTVVQYQNQEVDMTKVEERVKAQFVSEGHKASDIKAVNIYVKPEEYSAYYVINDKFSGRVDLF